MKLWSIGTDYFTDEHGNIHPNIKYKYCEKIKKEYSTCSLKIINAFLCIRNITKNLIRNIK